MEQFFIKSGSSFVYKIIENNTIRTVLKSGLTTVVSQLK